MSRSEILAGVDEATPVRLVVHAEDENTRIQVLDGNLQAVAGGQQLGNLEVELPPGGYAVRFYQGSDYHQKIVVLRPGQATEHVQLGDEEAPEFEAPAPIAGTSTTREFQRDPACDLSLEAAQATPRTTTGGAHLLLFVREPERGQRGDPSRGLELRAVDGGLVSDLHTAGKRDLEAGWAGVHLSLDPGAYRLRLNVEGIRTPFCEQTVYCCKGWQTQVFLLAADVGDGRGRRADLARMSVLMVRPEQGFLADRPDLRWTETALRALAERRNIPGSVRTEMLWAKFENPMLGIYAGLLHLRKPKVDPRLLREIVANLLQLVGPLPDVLAIGWGLALEREEFRQDDLFKASLDRPGDLATPPMLRASWEILVEATTLREDLVPRGSFTDRVSSRLSSGGSWLAWRGEPEPPAAEDLTAPPPAEIHPLLEIFGVTPRFIERLSQGTLSLALAGLAKILANQPDAGALLYSHRFTDLERRVAQYVYPLVDPHLYELAQESRILKSSLRESAKQRASDAAGLVKALQIPAGTALGAVWGLVRKLAIQPVLPGEALLGAFFEAEAHGNSALAAVLERFAETSTTLHHRRTRQPVSGLAYLYLRYRGSPAAPARKPPKASDLAGLLEEAEFVIGPAEKTVTPQTLGRILGSLRKTAVQSLEPTATGTALGPEWRLTALPAPSRYRRGALLATPRDDATT